MISSTDLYDIPITTIDGHTTTLAPYKGQVLLIVNVASRCGFTPQYAQLEHLYRQYKDQGFTVLGFPCNQFLHQEPGSNEEIQTFATQCYHVTFPMFEKVHVKQPEQSPLYTYLATHIEKKPLIFIPWNFTKILVDKSGHVKKRFLPTTSFKKVSETIEGLLTE